VANERISVAELNHSAQAAIAQVLANGIALDAKTLVDRLMLLGYRYRPYVASIVAKAFLMGMVSRVGACRPYIYRLVPDWAGDLDTAVPRRRRPSVKAAEPRRAHVADTEPPLAYLGPAFGHSTLAPSVGTVCGGISQEEREGELPPYLGGHIVDALHRRFGEIFGGVE
jgi:hypothetical protein